MKKNIQTVGALLILVGIVLLISYAVRRDSNEEEVFCTADALQCADGSYVGRVPPRCEFAPCEITQRATQGYFISVDAPLASAQVSQPFHVRGTAQIYDNIVQYELRDERQALITSGFVYTGAEEQGVRGPFLLEINSSLQSGSAVTLELFGRDGKHEKVASLKLPFLVK